MGSPSPTVSSPLLGEEPIPKRDRPCQQPPLSDARSGDPILEQGDSLTARLSQLSLRNKRLQATLQQRTAEQFQRMRSYEEMERQNRVMLEGLEQFQEALHGLREQVQTLLNKVDAIQGKL